jgi:hypothetical protein
MRLTLDIDRPAEEVEAVINDALVLWDRHVQLAEELTAAKNDELAALRAVRRYLSETAVGTEGVTPIMRLIGRLHDEREKAAGRPNASKPANIRWPMAHLAASVTALKVRKNVPIGDALRQIARAASLERRVLKNFRNNVISEVLSRETIATYKYSLRTMIEMSEAEFDDEIRRCAEISGGFLK